MVKNYYTILGILPTATAEDIKGAYRKRVKEYHPDHYGENSRPFLEVQEAYGVLSDPTHRSHYDRSIRGSRFYSTPPIRSQAEVLRRGRSPVEPLKGTGNPVDFGDIYLRSSFQTHHTPLDEIFDYIWDSFKPFSSSKSEKLQSLCLEFVLTPDEARRGGQMQILVPSHSLCPTCDGLGAVGFCHCYRCMGNGSVFGDVPLLVNYPPGISDGYQKAIALDSFGIHDIYLYIIFRIGSAG